MLAALRTSVHAMCVGPVTARPLVRLGVPTSAPERMRLGALARHITDELPLLQSRTMRVAGHLLEIRGTCVLVDGVGQGAVARPGWRRSARWRTVRAPWCRGADLLARAARQRHRHPRGGDGGAAAANGVGRQEHRLDRGEARLSTGRRRAAGGARCELFCWSPTAHANPQVSTMVGDLARRVSDLLGRQVHVAFVDVLGPTPREVLRAQPFDRPRNSGSGISCRRIPRPRRPAGARRGERSSRRSPSRIRWDRARARFRWWRNGSSNAAGVQETRS